MEIKKCIPLLILSAFILGTFKVGASNFNAPEMSTYQDQVVTGTVTTSTDGMPLPGVSIVVRGTTIGTQTDFDGNYSLEVPDDNAILVFSYVGFLTQEITAQGQTTIDVAMNEDVAALDEVVVIGYGTMKKQDVTGAVSSVEAQDIVSTPVPGIADAIKGRIAGVDITNTSGNPGAPQQIRIRGNRSISATNRPLVVVDGIPYAGDINEINPNDIKSIEVLKDASATAIYGSRGANGVILVSTKRGSTGEAKVTFDTYYGPTQIYGGLEVRNAEQYIQQRRDVAAYLGNDTSDPGIFQPWELDAIQNGVDTDWMSYVFRNGYRQNYQLSVSGGNENTQYLVSGGFYNEKAIVDKGDFSRYTFRLNLDQNVTDWLKLGTSTSITFSERNNGIYIPINSIQISPLASPYDDNGDLYVTDSPQRSNVRNPVARNFGASKDEDQWIQVNPNIYAEWNITQNLTYRLNGAASFGYTRNGVFQSLTYRHGQPPVASQRTTNTKDLLLENILSYNKTFGKHNIQATGLFSVQKNMFESLNANVQGLPYESQEFYNLGTAQTINGVGSDLQEWGLTSVMGRVHYGYDDKWLVTATMRADGSSRLAEGNKWGFFPSAAVGWKLSSEPFMQNQETFDNLKLRASFGRVGNTGINPYQTQGSLQRASYNFGNSNVFGYLPSELSNSDLGWEMTNTINFGVDFSLKGGRISGSLELYKQYTTDLILSRQLPPTSGFDAILENVGKTENTGFELTLQTTPVALDNGFVWNSDLTVANNNEEIVELFNGAEDDIGNEWFIGESVDSWYFYDAIGIWQESEASQAAGFNQVPGSVKLRDVNGDGSINADDRVILGSPTPNWVLGWNNSFRYKAFDMNIYMISRLGHVVKNGYYETLFTNAFAQDVHNGLVLDYWRLDNPVNDIPAASDYNLNDFPASLSYVKGDFLKIRDITLGYTLEKEKISKLPVESLRIYFTANNAIQFNKKFQGADIDLETDNGDIGRDNSGRFITPQAKAFILGLNVKF